MWVTEQTDGRTSYQARESEIIRDFKKSLDKIATGCKNGPRYESDSPPNLVVVTNALRMTVIGEVMLPFALNHMTVPGMPTDAFLDLAAALGCVGVEFRNDLPAALFDAKAPEDVRIKAKANGIRILALAEVKAFNDFSDAKLDEARALMEIAVACGAEAISLIPRNDGHGLSDGERQANLQVAVRELRPLLEAFGLIGLVEPLGFEPSSLRDKSEAVNAFEAVDGTGRFRLVHDTFHHHLAGGGSIFPEHTGLIHISGVVDPGLDIRDMRDEHRVLVDHRDRLKNVAQIEAFMNAGYAGPISCEAFSRSVHSFTDPKAELSGSFDFIASCLADMAA